MLARDLTPNTLIKQGAKLGGSMGGRVGRTALERAAGVRGRGRRASKPGAQASLWPDPALRPEEATVLETLRSDESLEMDGILESARNAINLL